MVLQDSVPFSFSTDAVKLSCRTYYIPSPCGSDQERLSSRELATPKSHPNEDPPTLIVLCAWMGALQPHVSKYIQDYRSHTIFSRSPILVVFTEVRDLILVPFWLVTRLRGFQRGGPVERILKGVVLASWARGISSSGVATEAMDEEGGRTMNTSNSTNPRVLVHSFSNGGAIALVDLAHLYKRVASDLVSSSQTSTPLSLPPGSLPAPVVILDSSPGRIKVRQVVGAMSVAMSKWVPRLLKRLVLSCIQYFLILSKLVGPQGRDLLSKARKGLVNPTLFQLDSPSSRGRCDSSASGSVNDTDDSGDEDGDGKSQKTDRDRSSVLTSAGTRVYIYSQQDGLVSHKDVREHAAVARDLGWNVVEAEFSGTEHVAHIRADRSRYWAVVTDAWVNANGGETVR